MHSRDEPQLHKPLPRSPDGGLGAVSHTKLANDVLDVLFGGLVADVQRHSSLCVLCARSMVHCDTCVNRYRGKTVSGTFSGLLAGTPGQTKDFWELTGVSSV